MEVAHARKTIHGGSGTPSDPDPTTPVCPTWLGKGFARGDGERNAPAGRPGSDESQPANLIGGLGSVVSCEVAVDSGAEESAWPKNWLPEVPAETSGAGRKRFIEANGQDMGHYGRKVMKFRREGCSEILSLGLR